jgi:hypothetical protein
MLICSVSKPERRTIEPNPGHGLIEHRTLALLRQLYRDVTSKMNFGGDSESLFIVNLLYVNSKCGAVYCVHHQPTPVYCCQGYNCTALKYCSDDESL